MKKTFLAFIFLSGALLVKAQTDSLQQYAGTYKFPEGSVVSNVVVSVQDSSLNMSSEAGNSSLTRIGTDSFLIERFNGTASFKRDDDKRVNGVHIEAMGYVLDGEKQPDGKWRITGSFTLVLPNNNQYQNL